MREIIEAELELVSGGLARQDQLRTLDTVVVTAVPISGGGFNFSFANIVGAPIPPGGTGGGFTPVQDDSPPDGGTDGAEEDASPIPEPELQVTPIIVGDRNGVAVVGIILVAPVTGTLDTDNFDGATPGDATLEAGVPVEIPIPPIPTSQISSLVEQTRALFTPGRPI